MLGIRLNGAAASMKLGMSGYYQLAFSLIRDLLETTHLIDYFLLDLTTIDTWRAGGDAAKKRFKPELIRNALDKRDGYKLKRRKEVYQQYCDVTHPSYRGFQLVAPKPERLVRYMPFFNDDIFSHFLFDLAKFMAHGTEVFVQHFPSVQGTCQEAIRLLVPLINDWREKHLPRTDLSQHGSRMSI